MGHEARLVPHSERLGFVRFISMGTPPSFTRPLQQPSFISIPNQPVALPTDPITGHTNLTCSCWKQQLYVLRTAASRTILSSKTHQQTGSCCWWCCCHHDGEEKSSWQQGEAAEGGFYAAVCMQECPLSVLHSC